MVSSSSTVFVLFSGSVPFSPRSVEETNVCRTELRTVCELLPHKEDLVGHMKKLELHVHLGYELSSRDLNQMDLFYCVGKKTTHPLKPVQISSLSSGCLFTPNVVYIYLI